MRFKRIILTTFISSIFLFSLGFYSCKEDLSGFEISGQLDNLEGTYFYSSYEVGDSIKIDTIAINEKGEFSFKGDIDTLTTMCLYLNQQTKNPSFLYVFVDKGLKVNVKGDALLPDLIEVKGGEINDDLTAFKNDNRELLKSRSENLTTALADTTASDKTLGEKNYVMNLKNINFELSNIAANYVKKNPEKIASVMLINNIFKDEASIPRLDENLDLLQGKAATFPLTEKLRDYSIKVSSSSVGAQAPYFSLKNTKDKRVSTFDYRGRYILLSFISTTCDVCNEEKSEAIALYSELKKKKYNIEFLTIVKDIEEEPIPKSYTDSIKWNLLSEYGGWSGKTFDLYNIHEIPYNILISPSGSILQRDIPLNELAAKLEELNTGTVGEKK